MDIVWTPIESAFARLPENAKLLGLLGLAGLLVLSWVRQLATVRKLRRKVDQLDEVLQKRDQYIDQLQTAHAEEIERLRDIRQLLQQWLAVLDKVNEHVWTRPASTPRPYFLPRGQRKTRFIAVCNLKGGVGKTTLVLNLGAQLGLHGKKVLLIDLDFQGSLSAFLVSPEQISEYRHKGWTTDRLLLAETQPEMIAGLAFPLHGVANCRGMIAKETLEMTEYAQQTRFFVNPDNDPRFHLQRLLHSEPVIKEYDYVLFDCPPRMTTSCVNALTCADYVLTPTSLSELDIEAVRRTLGWLRELAGVVSAKFLGAVVSRCKIIAGKLTHFDQQQLKNLEQLVASEVKTRDRVFTTWIAEMPEIHRATARKRPVVLDAKKGRDYFRQLVEELEARIK